MRQGRESKRESKSKSKSHRRDCISVREAKREEGAACEGIMRSFEVPVHGPLEGGKERTGQSEGGMSAVG